jgi:DNA-binding response OmpR family regulator
MKPLIPGRYTITSITTPDGGVIEVRLTDGGHWQIKGKTVEEEDWRSLCRGHIDGSIFDIGSSSGGNRPVRLGPLVVDPAGRRVEVRGAQVRLAAHEFELIEMLATDPGRVFTKHELLRELWGSRDESKLRPLDSHASRTRCKLRDAGAEGFIVNCHGLGYKLLDDGPARAS